MLDGSERSVGIRRGLDPMVERDLKVKPGRELYFPTQEDFLRALDIVNGVKARSVFEVTCGLRSNTISVPNGAYQALRRELRAQGVQYMPVKIGAGGRPNYPE